MNETLTKLQTVVVDASAPTSVTFSNIPQSYTDLKIVVSIRNSRSGFDRAPLTMRLGNGSVDTGSNYSYRDLQGIDGSTAATTSSGTYIQIGNTPSSTSATSTFGNMEIYIPNYTSSTAKSISVDYGDESTSTSWMVAALGGLWNNTAPINIITFQDFITSSSFLQYSTFTLYGVKNLSTTYGNSIKATGGTITTDGTYVYHTFNSTGAFQPSTRLLADVLVVAGGGGGAGSDASDGGGGAGGVIYFTSQPLTNGTSYACTVGSGGAVATNGVNSYFGSLTAAVGGGGGNGNDNNVGQSGGSGGGAGTGGSTTTNAGGSSTQTGTGAAAYYGNAGGSGTGSGSGSGRRYNGGGGGGAGTAGGNASGSNAGNGGDGTSAFSTLLYATNTGVNVNGTYYIAGGGGGWAGGESSHGTPGTGGLGGGGNGGINSSGPTVGAVNTGSGGGAGGFQSGSRYAGVAGGSGLIIIRYKM